MTEAKHEQMQSFFAYEEYGAKYDLMARDLASTYQTLGTDDSFEKGIEVLSRTLDSMKIRSEHGRKGMTFSDLVIKVRSTIDEIWVVK